MARITARADGIQLARHPRPYDVVAGRTAYPDGLRFVIAVKGAGILIADASSSKNAALFLRQIRLDTFAQEHGISSPVLRPGLTLLDYFDADVSGRDFAHGKPDPEIFLTAARELGGAQRLLTHRDGRRQPGMLV